MRESHQLIAITQIDLVLNGKDEDHGTYRINHINPSPAVPTFPLFGSFGVPSSDFLLGFGTGMSTIMSVLRMDAREEKSGEIESAGRCSEYKGKERWLTAMFPFKSLWTIVNAALPNRSTVNTRAGNQRPNQLQMSIIRVIKVDERGCLPKMATRPSAALANAMVSTPGEVGTSLKDW
jgi:hypothetical protein